MALSCYSLSHYSLRKSWEPKSWLTITHSKVSILQKEELVVLKLIFCTTPEILVQLDMLLSFTGYAGV
ncbi:hypothetical protein VPH35_108789 [Triticum aestivum]